MICSGERPPGWAVEDRPAAGERPGFAFTVGLWHHFGSPEAAIFGLAAEERREYLSRVGDAARGGRMILPDQCEDDILGVRMVIPRPVLAGWHRQLFPALLDFYRGQPVPVVQLVCADAGGRYPWDAGCDQSCVDAQPRLWDRVRMQPRWATDPDPPGWLFPTPPDTLVAASPEFAYGAAAAVAVIHDEDGEWEFLAGGGGGTELTVVHLAHLLARQRDLAVLADLPTGWEAQRVAPGAWQRMPLDDED